MRNQRFHAVPETPTASWTEARIERSKSKRIAHGGGAWSLPDAHDRLMQPQDGARAADDGEARVSRFPAREPEDARITGGTRSLMRRVMGLNVTARPGARKPARPVMLPDAHAHVA